MPKDAEKAVQWWRDAADQGYSNAQFNLGVMYYNGEGVEKSYRQAADWFQRAADQGFQDAAMALDKMRKDGLID